MRANIHAFSGIHINGVNIQAIKAYASDSDAGGFGEYSCMFHIVTPCELSLLYLPHWKCYLKPCIHIIKGTLVGSAGGGYFWNRDKNILTHSLLLLSLNLPQLASFGCVRYLTSLCTKWMEINCQCHGLFWNLIVWGKKCSLKPIG
jgi:hypothetical protein